MYRRVVGTRSSFYLLPGRTEALPALHCMSILGWWGVSAGKLYDVPVTYGKGSPVLVN